MIDRITPRFQTVAQTPGLYYQESFTPVKAMTSNEKALRVMSDKIRYEKKLSTRRSTALLAIGALSTYLLIFCCIQLGDASNGLHKYIPSLLHKLDFSTAKNLICYLASKNSLPIDFGSEDSHLKQILTLGTRAVQLTYPIGLASGFDVNCDGPDAFFGIGFGNVEIGTISMTPPPSEPLSSVDILGTSLIYSSSSSVPYYLKTLERLQNREKTVLGRHGVLGVSLRAASMREMSQAILHFSDHCEYLSFDFRHLNCFEIIILITGILDKVENVGIFLKVSSDLEVTDELINLINAKKGITGISISGTVTAQDGRLASGSVSKSSSTTSIKNWRAKLSREKLIFASGGVMNGADALEKIEAGANLVQIFSGFYFLGARAPRMIKSHLSDKLCQKGYLSLSEAIGAEGRPLTRRMIDFKRKRRKF